MAKPNNALSVEQNSLDIIPDFTFDDFMSERVYEWLYAQKDNKFALQLILSRVQQIAKQVKFSGFMKTWNSYVESKSPKATILGSNQTLFPKQPVQLECGQYVADEYGVSLLNKLGEEIEVCSHPIMPVGRIINQDTGQESIRIAFCRGKKKWKEIIIPKQEAFKADKAVSVLSSHGIAITSESAKYLVRFLCDVESLNYDILPEISVTSNLGWHGNDFVPYADNLKYDGNSEIISSLCEHGSFQTWLDKVNEIRKQETRYLPARMALAASFASPLLSKLGYLSSWCNLNSTISSSGKSVALMLAASVWGNPHIGKGLPKSANSTTNALEVQAATLRSIPLFIDELQTMQGIKGFAETAYNLCEGSLRSRLKRNAELRSRSHWNLITISTGEQAVTNSLDHEGAIARVVEVRVKKQIFLDPHSMVDTLLENYGFAGKMFINAIANEDFSALKQEVNNTSRKLQAEGIQPKQADTGSVFLLADRLAEKYIFRDGVTMNEDEVKQFLKNANDTDMNRRIYEHVCGWCLQYRNNFQYAGNNPKPYYGKIVTSESEADPKNATVYSILKNALKAELNAKGFDYESFLEWCVRNKAVDNKQGKQSRHNGSNPEWHIDFHIDIFDHKSTDTEKSTYTPVSPEEVPDLPF